MPGAKVRSPSSSASSASSALRSFGSSGSRFHAGRRVTVEAFDARTDPSGGAGPDASVPASGAGTNRVDTCWLRCRPPHPQTALVRANPVAFPGRRGGRRPRAHPSASRAAARMWRPAWSRRHRRDVGCVRRRGRGAGGTQRRPGRWRVGQRACHGISSTRSPGQSGGERSMSRRSSMAPTSFRSRSRFGSSSEVDFHPPPEARECQGSRKTITSAARGRPVTTAGGGVTATWPGRAPAARPRPGAARPAPRRRRTGRRS